MKIMLIDGNSIVNRAFYAIPLLTNKDNIFTNAVYGFLNIFMKLYDEEQPEYIAVAFDVSAPTFRHLQYSEYKGHRKGMPDELRQQMPLLKNLLNKMNIKIYEIEGFEADDVLGTLSVKAEKENLTVVLVSGDKDMLQLATDSTKIRIPKTKSGKTEIEDYYASDVHEKFGVTPRQFIDVKALMGDQSDNIPGVAGIGEKTALKIIQEYDNIENAIEHAHEIKPKRASENLSTSREIAMMSKQLATIVTDVPLDFNIEQLKADNIFNDNVLGILRELDFKSMLSRFVKVPKDHNVANSEYKIIVDKDNAMDFMENLMKSSVVAYKIIFDNEEFIGIAFSNKENHTVFLKCGNDLTQEYIIHLCSKFFMSDIKKIAHDAKKDMVYLNKFGIELNNMIFDCMIAAYVLNASKGEYNYNDIAEDFLNENYPSEENLLGKGRNRQSIHSLSEDEFKNYVCGQCDILFRAYSVMDKQIKENDQDELYYDIEHPLIEVLKDMELYGIKINKDALIAYGEELKDMINVLTDEIYELAGEQFNINSPKQLGCILFEKLQLKGSKRTKTGWSTSADVLEKLNSEHKIISKILMYRTLAKLNSTYVEGLIAVMDENTGKIYSTFNQTATVTGRISSTEPNLQNIPIRLEIGHVLRKVFVPESEEFIFIDGDYSQIELKVLAHMAEDETLIDAFRNDQDIHRLTASQVFKIPFEEVTDAQRGNAKAVNFGIVYGIGAFSLSQDLKITKKEAERYIDGYFEKYPSVKQFMDKTISDAKESGYVTTIFGRRRLLPELQSSNFNNRAFGERAAMNMPIQGSAADIIKIAMVRVHKRLKQEKLQSRIILQIHDELLLETKKEELDYVKQLLKEEMEIAVDLKVTLSADIHVGHNWYDAK